MVQILLLQVRLSFSQVAFKNHINVQDTSRKSNNINHAKSKEQCLTKEIDTVEYRESPFT
jgi:hypothetical protein